MSFSRRFIFIYTSIIVVPLLLIVMCVANYVETQWFNELKSSALSSVAGYANDIAGYVNTFDLINKVVYSNSEMIFLVANPDSSDNPLLVTTILDEDLFFSRLMTAMPQIYAVRLFVDNPAIPERWPYLLSSSRTNLSALDEWEFNYAVDYLGYQEHLQRPSVVQTLHLTYNRRNMGYVQIAMLMQDFFHFLYKPSQIAAGAAYAFTLGEDGLEAVPGGSIHGSMPEEERERLAKECAAAEQNDGGVFTMASDGTQKIVAWCKVQRLNLVLVHVNSTEQIQTQLVFFRLGMILILFVVIFLVFAVIKITTTQFMSRIYSVVDGMHQVKQGDFSVLVPVNGSDEITEVQQIFNDMVAQLGHQIEQISNEQKLVAETEVKAMQNQINAHFLYNVLETIKMQAVIADADDIVESITLLGRMMRYCLRWRSPMVTIRQEIEHVCSYVGILNIRNDYVVSLVTEISTEYLDVMVPKMVLQPLIENAFVYAVEPAQADSEIRVFTEPDFDNKRVWLCVQDFGRGIPEERLQSLRAYLDDDTFEKNAKGGIGLKNIQQRLTMFYGREFRIRIDSTQQCGTRVSIPIPLEIPL